MFKSRRIKWMGYVAHMEDIGMFSIKDYFHDV
jgi:hypothetical protein